MCSSARAVQRALHLVARPESDELERSDRDLNQEKSKDETLEHPARAGSRRIETHRAHDGERFAEEREVEERAEHLGRVEEPGDDDRPP